MDLKLLTVMRQCREITQLLKDHVHKVETETGNAQMLLGCLLLIVQDSAALEVFFHSQRGCKLSAIDPFSRECMLNLHHTL